MASAYLFYLAQNHPFVDGNKRTALVSALTFLWMNDIEVEADEDALTDLVLSVAEGRTTKAEIAEPLALADTPHAALKCPAFGPENQVVAA